MNAWRLLGFSVDYLNLTCALPSELPEDRERCGLLLLTGPANSGKTSLLRALVCAVADPHEVSAVLPTVSREDRCESTQHVHLAHCGSEMRASSRVRYDDRTWTCSGNTTYNPTGMRRPFVVAYGPSRGDTRRFGFGIGSIFSDARIGEDGPYIHETDRRVTFPSNVRWTVLDAEAATLRELRKLDAVAERGRFYADLCRVIKELTSIDAMRYGPEKASHCGAAYDLLRLGQADSHLLAWVVDMAVRWHALDRGALADASGFAFVDNADLYMTRSRFLTVLPKLRELFPRMTFVVSCSHEPEPNDYSLTLALARAGNRTKIEVL